MDKSNKIVQLSDSLRSPTNFYSHGFRDLLTCLGFHSNSNKQKLSFLFNNFILYLMCFCSEASHPPPTQFYNNNNWISRLTSERSRLNEVLTTFQWVLVPFTCYRRRSGHVTASLWRTTLKRKRGLTSFFWLSDFCHLPQENIIEIITDEDRQHSLADLQHR